MLKKPCLRMLRSSSVMLQNSNGITVMTKIVGKNVSKKMFSSGFGAIQNSKVSTPESEIKAKQGTEIAELKKLDLQELKNDKNFDYELFEKKKKVIDKQYEDMVKITETKVDFEWYEKLIIYPILMFLAYWAATVAVDYLKTDSPPFKRALERGEKKRKQEKQKLWEEIVEERNKIVEEREKKQN